MRLFLIFVIAVSAAIFGYIHFDTFRSYQKWRIETSPYVLHQSPDCVYWSNATSNYFQFHKLLQSLSRFISLDKNGLQPVAIYRTAGDSTVVAADEKRGFLYYKNVIYAFLDGRIRIKSAGYHSMPAEILHINESRNLLAEATLKERSVQLIFYGRGRMAVTCNTTEKNVSCIDSNLAMIPWTTVTRLVQTPVYLMNAICHRLKAQVTSISQAQAKAKKSCGGAGWKPYTDIRAICPHIPEI